MTSTEPRKRTAPGGADARARGVRVLNATLATALSVGIGLGPSAPAWATTAEARESTVAESPLDEARPSGAADADGGTDVRESAGSAEAVASTGDGEDSSAPSVDAASAESAQPRSSGEGRSLEEPSAEARESAVDLGALWEGQSGGTSSPLSITEGGTYRLTGDLTVNSQLEVNAPGADVTIDLGSFSLTSRAERASYVIKATSCASLSIVGDFDPSASGVDAASAQIVMEGGTLSHAVESAADSLAVRGVGVLLRADDEHNSLSSLDAAGVYATRGDVSIERCGIVIDHSNQTKANQVSSGLTGFPRGICLEGGVASARIVDTSVAVTGSQVVEAEAGTESLAACADVYGLYSATTGEVVVAGGSFAAYSAHGTATALFGPSLSVETASDGGAVALAADGGASAVGIRSTAARGVLIDAAVDFSLPAAFVPLHQAALASDVEDAFVLGPRFSAQGASVLVGESFSSANGDGVRIAAFSPEVGDEERRAMAGMLENGLSDGACSVVLDDQGACFRLDPSQAPACVVAESGAEELFASVDEALAAASDGRTVRLLRDAGDVVVDVGSSSDQIAIDLNGKSVRTLDVTTDATVRVFSSGGARGGIEGFSSDLGGAVSYSGSGSLELSGVDVLCACYASSVTGVSVTGSGTLALDDVSVTAVSQTSSVYGIRQSSGASSVTVRGGSVSATTDTPGVAAYGAAAAVAGASLSIEDCTVRAVSVNGTTGGLDARGPLNAKDTTVEARTNRAATTVWAVRAVAGTAEVSLDACELRAVCDEDASSGAYWCLMAGGAVPSNTAAWTLDGACSFESANDTHLGFSGTPVTLGSSFSVPSRLVVYASGLDGDVAFVPGVGADLSGLAGRVAACEESPYAGFSLRANEEGALQWSGRTVARNVETGEEFASLADALAAAEAGQTVRLAADCTVREGLSADVPVTVDLDGRTLDVVLSENALGSSVNALSFAGDGESRLQNGAVAVTMAAGTAAVARSLSFDAISLDSGASLVLDDVSVSLDFSSSASGTGDTAVTGVDAGSGAIELAGGSSVGVSVSGAQAASAAGVKASGGSGSVTVGRGCSVAVDNRAEAQQRGSIAFPSRSSSLDGVQLERVALEEGTDLYEEVQRKFKERALVDMEGDTAGYLYGTRMYYAAPILLDDGTYVWAFSEPLDAFATCDPADMEASYVYFQAYRDVVPDARGVVAGSAETALEVAGSVSATSAEGNAFAVSVDGEGEAGSAHIAATASLSAQSGTEPYRKESGSFDLRDEIGPQLVSTSRVVYPISGAYTLVKTVLPEAAAVGGDGAATVDVDASASLSATGGDGSELDAGGPPDYFPDTVEVTFTNLRDGSGDLLADESRTQEYGSALGADGPLPAAPDYERDGVVYRFVGWSVGMESGGARTWNPDRIEDGLTLDRSALADSGAVVLTAVYVPVGENEHLAVYEIDDFVEACGVSDGQTPSYRDAQRGATSSVPAKYERTTGVTYRFVGWDSEDGSATYAGTLPRAEGDCRYIARFAETPTMVDAVFYTWKTVDGTLTYAADSKKVAYGSAPDAAAASLAKAGDVVYGESEVYEFLGWSPRRSDSLPLYTDGLPPQTTPTYVGPALGVSSQLFGIYRVRERVVDVTFVVDGQEYAVAEDVPTGRTVNGAFLESGAERPADKGETDRFRGWALGSADGTLLMGAVKTLSELTEGEDDIVLYAVFGAGQTADEQYEEEGGGEDGPDNAADAGSSGTTGSTGGVGNAGGSSGAPSYRGGAPSAVLSATTPTMATGGSLAPTAREDAGSEAAASADGQAVFAREAPASSPQEDGAEDALSEPTEEEGRLGNVVSFFAGIVALAGVGAGAALRAWRNRRLDAEDDFYEPEALGDQGEQVRF